MVTKTIFTIFSSSKWKVEIWYHLYMDVTELESTCYFFSRNLLLLSSSPVLYSNGLLAERVPYEKQVWIQNFPVCQFTSCLLNFKPYISIFQLKAQGINISNIHQTIQS